METLLTLCPAGVRSRLSPAQVERSSHLARLACQALIAEAELTPKPGLVDRRGPGSHSDLSLALMRRSARAIEPYFLEMARISTEARPSLQLRENLGVIGRKAERAMLVATGGSNSHKGAIWSLGLLVSAAAIQAAHGAAKARFIARIAAAIASHDDQRAPIEESHGRLTARKYGVAGARGEAVSGFPHIIGHGLPRLRAKRFTGVREEVARLDALLGIMSSLADTCVLYRGGPAALYSVRHGATAVIEAGGYETFAGRRHFQQLDERLRALGVSPGGSADLLAATLFLDAIEQRKAMVQADQGELEIQYAND